MRVVNEEDIGQIIPPSISQTTPRESAIIGTHDQSISAGGPAQQLVSKVDRRQTRAGAHVDRKPHLPTITSSQHHAAFARRPSMQLVGEKDREELRRNQRINRLQRSTTIICVQNSASITDYHCVVRRSESHARER